MHGYTLLDRHCTKECSSRVKQKLKKNIWKF
ncbi:hypothetical protein EU348_00030 [Chryseobacterium indologenes]|uniref:Uncharacterized protein n=1 Tax=Chryseobacterium indologenes TaxID=253 RepID=A0A411DGX2_CHRID|nr:hypothetical protein EU348_00030 [Chryseobacterium indologenes]